MPAGAWKSPSRGKKENVGRAIEARRSRLLALSARGEGQGGQRGHRHPFPCNAPISTRQRAFFNSSDIFWMTRIGLSQMHAEAGGATGMSGLAEAEGGTFPMAGLFFALPAVRGRDASEKHERPWPRAGVGPPAPSTAVESVPANGKVLPQPERDDLPKRSPP